MDTIFTATGNFIMEQTGTTGMTLLLDTPTSMGSIEIFVTIGIGLLYTIGLLTYIDKDQIVIVK